MGSYTISREGARNLAVWESFDLWKMVYWGAPNAK
jgi:hypothetical protein